jgi:hypothetical protein
VTVAEVFELSDKCVVFLDTNSCLQWEYDEKICAHGEASATEAITLLAQLQALTLSPRLGRHGVSLIAASLSRAFEERTAADNGDFFLRARSYIEARQVEPARFAYVCTSVCITLLALATATAVGFRQPGTPELSFVAAAALGLSGALLSILLRFNTLAIGPYSSRFYVSLGGAVLLLLGAGFGAILLLLQRAGFVLSYALGNWHITAVCTLVAGFSERLVPDLLARLEDQIMRPPAKPKTT